jgi:ESCRT-I complex subunit VPS37
LILRIYVPVEGEKVSLFRGGILPQMSLVGVRATHDWFDARMKLIGYSPLQSDWEWNQSSLLLGSAVQDIVQHLQLNPPQIIEITNPDLARLQAKFPTQPPQPTHHVRRSNKEDSMITNQPNHNVQANHIQSSHLQRKDCSPPPNYDSWVHTEASVSAVTMPTIPTEYSDVLEDLSFDELQILSTDQTALERLAETTEVFPELATMRRNALVQLEDNVTLANELLEKEEESKELRMRVQDLKESLVQKLMTFDELSKQQDAFGVGVASSSMHHQQQQQYQSIKHALKKERKKAFDESEAYATQWVESNDEEVPLAKPISVSEFTNKFIKMRLAMHQRAAKLERLHYLTAGNAPSW